MKKRQILSTFLSVALVAGMCATPAGATYSDTAGHAAQAAIQRWSDYRVILGDEQGRFLPNAPLTRGAFAAILDRVMGYRTTAENTFSDLPADAWYTPYVLRLNAVGVLQGDGAQAMPESEVTRQEVVALLGRALGLEERKTPLLHTDKDRISDWAAGYLATMVEKGAFRGETAFRPTEAMTRAETVVLLDTLITSFIHADGDYSTDAKGDMVVNARNVTLKDMSIGGDLIIADGVGDGDVYLDNVTVEGRVILRGCGVNSFHLLPGTVVAGTIIVTKTADGGIRLVNESGNVLPMINVADGKDGVTLTGAFDNVIIASDAPVELVGATVKESVSVTAPGANVTVSGTSDVNNLDVAKTAQGATVAAKDTAVVKSVAVGADNLTLNNQSSNKDKTTVTVDGSVTNKPTAPGGGTVAPPSTGNNNNSSNESGGSSNNSGGGGSGGSGGGSSGGGTTPTPPVPTTPPAPTTLTAVAALLPSPLAGKPAVDAVPSGAGYTVATDWSPALAGGKFETNTVYTATLTFSLANEQYRWGTAAPTASVGNSSGYGAAAMVGAPVLNAVAKTVIVTAEYPKTASKVELVIGHQPQDLTLTEGGTADHELSISATVKADNLVAPNYLISYQWYRSDSNDMSGKTEVTGATSASYRLPSGLAEGIHYYTCIMSADGVGEVTSDVVSVTVEAVNPGSDIVLTELTMAYGSNTFPGLQLTWKTSDPQQMMYLVHFYNGDSLITDISGKWGIDADETTTERSLLLEYVFRKLLSDQQITKISVTPCDDKGAPLGGGVALEDLTISVTLTSLGNVSASFDASTKEMQFTNLSIINSYIYVMDLTANGNTFDSIFRSNPTQLSNQFSAAAMAENARIKVYQIMTTRANGQFRMQIFHTAPLTICLTPSGS